MRSRVESFLLIFTKRHISLLSQPVPLDHARVLEGRQTLKFAFYNSPFFGLHVSTSLVVAEALSCFPCLVSAALLWLRAIQSPVRS
jgi:hypothetical protein